jgi:hypothetical protein
MPKQQLQTDSYQFVLFLHVTSFINLSAITTSIRLAAKMLVMNPLKQNIKQMKYFSSLRPAV